MTKPAKPLLARELRQAGLPYKRIATQLGVSPSSVHLWTRDIVLTEAQKAFNLRGPRGPQNPDLVRRRAEGWGREMPGNEARVSGGGAADGAGG